MSDAPPKPAQSRSRAARYQPIVIVLAAVVVGILADRVRPIPLAAWWTVAVAGLGLWLLVPASRRASLLLRNVALLLAVAATAGAWHHCRWHLFADDDLGRYASRKPLPICVEAVALESPRALPPV